MNLSNPFLILVILEVAAVLLVLLGAWGFVALRRWRRDLSGVRRLVDRLHQEESDRLVQVQTLLASSSRLQGGELDQAARRVVEEERSLYKALIALYLRHDEKALAALPEQVDRLVKPYHQLIVPEGQSKANAGADGWVEPDLLQEHLRITLETIRKMVDDYAVMFNKEKRPPEGLTGDQLLRALAIVAGDTVPPLPKAVAPSPPPVFLPPDPVFVDDSPATQPVFPFTDDFPSHQTDSPFPDDSSPFPPDPLDGENDPPLEEAPPSFPAFGDLAESDEYLPDSGHDIAWEIVADDVADSAGDQELPLPEEPVVSSDMVAGDDGVASLPAPEIDLGAFADDLSDLEEVSPLPPGSMPTGFVESDGFPETDFENPSAFLPHPPVDEGADERIRAMVLAAEENWRERHSSN